MKAVNKVENRIKKAENGISEAEDKPQLWVGSVTKDFKTSAPQISR